MRVYTVHQNPDPLAGDQVIFIKEGFSWPALVFSLLWALYHRLWWVAGGYVVISLAIELLATGLEWPVIGGVVSLAFTVLFAAEANDLRRWSLHRRGWTEVGVVSGRGRDEAERRFFSLYGVTSSGSLIPRGGAFA
ncbi:MAG: DUF2628 domain-containing protein [Alphaproteobacteria bacterium]|nr:DUF2628 domain-containing protein [Alphaproteobacteria bacterium]